MFQLRFLLVFCLLLLFDSITAQQIAVNLDKMDVLYVGVDNQISILHEGLSSSEFQVKADKGTLICVGTGKYTIRPTKPGEVTITVSTGSGKTYRKVLRAKRIPDPVPALGATLWRSDTIEPGRFKAQGGISLLLRDFDFDIKCEVVKYKVTHIGAEYIGNGVFTHSVTNKGARFGTEATAIISEGVPGDLFIFSHIMARCPCDERNRHLNDLVFLLRPIEVEKD